MRLHYVRFYLATASLLFLLLPGSTSAQDHEREVTLAIVGGRLIDGFGGPPMENSVILIAGDSIAAVGMEGEVEIPASARLLSAEGMTVMPGLWESHGHLFHIGEGDPSMLEARFPDRRMEVMASVARTSLMAGITSFRDTGGPLAEQQKLRAKIEDQETPGPRLFLAGPILRQRDPATPASPGDFSAATPAEAREVAQRVIAMGVDQIKVYGFWDLEILREITAVAHGAGIGVDADVRHIRAYRTAIEAGVDRLHHVFTADPLSDYSDEDFRLLVRGLKPVGTGPSANILRGPFIVPTIEMRLSYARAFRFPEVVDHPRFRNQWPSDIYSAVKETWSHIYSIPWGQGAPERIKHAKRKLRRFVEMGGREQLVAGCDAGSPLNFHPAVTREIANLVEAGLTPMEAIQSATLRPAQMQGMDQKLGTITPGKLADIIVVDGDPLQEITTLQTNVVHVVKGGVVYK